VYGGESRSAYSEEKNANDDSVKSAEKSKYQGYAFAGFAAAMAMLTGFIFAALLLKSRYATFFTLSHLKRSQIPLAYSEKSCVLGFAGSHGPLCFS
jgi:hypothetical protein